MFPKPWKQKHIYGYALQASGKHAESQYPFGEGWEVVIIAKAATIGQSRAIARNGSHHSTERFGGGNAVHDKQKQGNNNGKAIDKK